jgi:hypothetical protein
VPSEGAAGATAGATDDGVAKEAMAKKRAMGVVAIEKAAVAKATVEKVAADGAMVDKTATVKITTDKATMDKATADKAATDKATGDRATTDTFIVNERAAEDVDAKKTATTGAAEKSIMESTNLDATLAPVEGCHTKRLHPSPEAVLRCLEVVILFMTKLGKYGKIELSGLLFWTIRFWQFHGKTKEGAKLKDLKIQDVLMHGKGLKGNMELRWKKSKPKAEATKTGLSSFGYRSIRFSQNR